MTVIRPNSISGITSLTAHRGSIDFYAHDGSAARFDNINSNVTSGVSTFASLNITGDLDVGGALTYEDVTNIDSVGVITARNGIDVTGGTVTITTGANSASPAGSGDNLVIKDSNGCGLSILSGNGNSQNIYFGSTSDNDAVRLEGFYNSGSPYFNIYTAGSERLRITSGGLMGLGTQSPSSLLTLRQTAADHRIIEISRPNSDVGCLYLGNDSSSNALIASNNAELIFGKDFSGTFSEFARIDNNGLVGIGTDNPLNGLDILQSNGRTRVTSFGHIITQNHVHGTTNYWSIAPRNGGELDIAYGSPDGNGTITGDKLTITTDGKVLINSTANSDAQLLVKSADKLHPALKLDGLSANGFSLLGDEYQTDESHFTMGIAYSSASLVTGWGVKVSPTGTNEYLSSQDTYSTKHSATRHDNDGWRFLGSSTSQTITTDSGVSISERFRITPEGKVGIGEDTPSYRLHIKETTSSSNYALVENTTTGNAGLRIKNSQGDYLVFVGPDFRVYDYTNSVDRLRIDSSGRILKGISSSILGSSDVQLAGSGGPAKIAGYKADNNPTANNSMLTVTGYSQSGSTFTGIGEIDFRVNQNSNTASGYHPGSIVTRVNGGSTTGTHSGAAYSYAGLKDRERITFKSKRYYCLPEYTIGDIYNNFREEWDYQHYVGYNQYSWYRFTSHSSSSSRGGSVDIRVTWSTRHASGNGYGHYAFHWRDSHANGYMEIGNVYRYHQNHLSGSYYGWSGSPQLDVYEINDSGNDAGFYLRLQGHISANGNTYDGGVMHQFTISAHTNRYGADVNKFEFVGNSTPSDVGSLQGLVNLP